MGEQPETRRGFVSRIGTFFILVGAGFMLFFFISQDANVTNLNYFCWGSVLIVLGLALQGRFKEPPGPPSGRFGVLGRIKSAMKRGPKEEKK